ncbi:trimeric intracellular cation channel family protein [Desulfovibrio cuneatus]|uniref:trimeric intracellular cation channel family protein n=1 Tax=Desulfovibrio cuneatus TaxID=159728 RepID=UPI000414E55E|nr:trimeric intracellular cation channel family protein [Desulfovibrio cuneatus]
MEIERVVVEQTVSTFVTWLNSAGIVVFAISGALAGIRRQIDIFGILVLAFITSSFGGICRDVMLGIPPAVVQDNYQLGLSLGAGLLAYVAYPLMNKLRNPIEFFDALGLGAFTVLGAEKALSFGITPLWAVTLGVVTAVGGGVGRDLLVGEVPSVLRREVYATAAFLGGGVLVLGTLWLPEWQKLFMASGVLACCWLRVYSLYRNWNLPRRKGV